MTCNCIPETRQALPTKTCLRCGDRYTLGPREDIHYCPDGKCLESPIWKAQFRRDAATVDTLIRKGIIK